MSISPKYVNFSNNNYSIDSLKSQKNGIQWYNDWKITYEIPTRSNLILEIGIQLYSE